MKELSKSTLTQPIPPMSTSSPSPRSGSTPRKPETVTGCWLSDLRPSEVVHETIPDPAEQAPLVARSVTPPSPSGRGGTTLPRQRAPRSCTVFVMTPPNDTSEGGRDDRGVPYHAESTLSSAQVLRFPSAELYIRFKTLPRASKFPSGGKVCNYIQPFYV